MRTKQSIPALKPYQPGKSIDEVKKEHNLSRIVKLASNENVYGPSPHVIEKLGNFAQEIQLYPDGYAEKLRERVSEYLQVDMDQLIFGAGSDEIVQMICRTYLEAGTNTVMAHPTFPQYKHHATVEGAEVREVPVKDGHHQLEKMLQYIDENTRVVWLCTPNNPTGSYINEQELNHFVQECPKHVLIVIDEAYYEFVMSGDYPETIPYLKDHENMIILRTFSKAYGLAGYRIGYGVGSTDIIRYLNTIRGPFNVSSIGQYAALVALEDQDYIEQIRQLNAKTRKQVERFCKENDLAYDQSETNFLLIHLPKSGLEVSEQLLSNGFIVRPGELLGVEQSMRVTIGKEEDMKEFTSVLQNCLQN
ncbi:histidinol-phosphate transaminase [Salinibacillus xinjiangensis]|uniref:Histidinol-phosphate aminotransferase n=1 Tax=Salinibacillus xinjiangensis TaxID=1229268 RepID=A0A6G1X644_9BACI|nr:histidinol-phosphate transaminase [Salinibacillus xinjiangensis]MRG86399.1 histidinol-phosphate transaminase [Salinibacillus xinjiangensis]